MRVQERSETWIMSDVERTLIDKEYVRLARLAMGAWRKVDAEGKWETNENFLKLSKCETLITLLGRRKATWIGHLKRREDKDPWAKSFLEGASDERGEHAEWWKTTKRELAECGVTVDDVLSAFQQPTKIRELFNKQ